MDVERLAEEYVKRKATLDALTKTVGELKEMLSDVVDTQGVPDENGHLWLTAGDFLLQRQKRQGQKYLNTERATEWAKGRGIWDEVKVVKEELSEDAVLGYVFSHRNDDDGIEAEFQALYEEPKPTWAFIAPKVQKQYDY